MVREAFVYSNYILRSALAFVISFLILSGGLTAQEPCLLECDPVTNPYQVIQYTVEVEPGCNVTLICRVRQCSGMNELIVDGVVLNGSCATTVPSSAAQMALQLMVTQNFMNFPPGPNDTEGTWTWRVARKACWKRLNAQPAAPLVPCSDNCCVNHITVRKRSGCDHWEFVSETGTTPWRQCADQVGQWQGGEIAPEVCTHACGYLVPVLKK